MPRAYLLIGAIVTLVACKARVEDDKAANTSLYPHFDAKAELAHIRGVQEISGCVTTFADAKARRVCQGEVEVSTLEMPHPGRVWLRREGGGAVGLGYSRNGDDVYINAGWGGEVDGDRILIAAGFLPTTLIVVEGNHCEIHQAIDERDEKRGFRSEASPAQCRRSVENGRQKIEIEFVTPGPGGEPRQRDVYVVGTAVGDEVLFAGKLTPLASLDALVGAPVGESYGIGGLGQVCSGCPGDGTGLSIDDADDYKVASGDVTAAATACDRIQQAPRGKQLQLAAQWCGQIESCAQGCGDSLAGWARGRKDALQHDSNGCDGCQQMICGFARRWPAEKWVRLHVRAYLKRVAGRSCGL